MISYPIYIKDRLLVITNDMDYQINLNGVMHFYQDDISQLKKINDDFVNDNNQKSAVIHCKDAMGCFGQFGSFYKVIEAAGGLVFNELNQLLLIYRKGKWDLPKGKIDEGESEVHAAKREVQEECGLKAVEVFEKLGVTYHTFFLPRENILKVSHWYRMKASSKEILVPQVEEDIQEIVWSFTEDINPDKLDTYLSVRDFLKRILNKSTS